MPRTIAYLESQTHLTLASPSRIQPLTAGTLDDLANLTTTDSPPQAVVISTKRLDDSLTCALTTIRQHYTGAIVVHLDKANSADRCAALAAGADHVLHGAVHEDEIWAQSSTRLLTAPVAHAHWELDPKAGNVRCRATQRVLFTLSTRELELLSFLAAHPNQIIKRQALDAALFPHAGGHETHRINMILTRLQNRFKRHETPLPVRSVFAQGVMFWTEKRRASD